MKIKQWWTLLAILNYIYTWYVDMPYTGFVISVTFILFFYLSWAIEILSDIKDLIDKQEE